MTGLSHMRHFAWIAAAAAVDKFSVMFRSPTALAIVLMTLDETMKWGVRVSVNEYHD